MSARSPFSASGSPKSSRSSSSGWSGRRRRFRSTTRRSRASIGSCGGMQLESLYPVRAGIPDDGRGGLPRSTFRIRCSSIARRSRCPTRRAASLPASERLHLDAAYQRYDWRARARWNGADFYDLFGPTKTGRKGYLVEAGHTNTLVFDEPRRLELDVDGTIAGGLDRLPEYQNVAGERSIGCFSSRRSCRTRTSESRSATWTTSEGSGGRR